MTSLKSHVGWSLSGFAVAMLAWCSLIYGRWASLDGKASTIDVVVFFIVSGVLLAWGRDVMAVSGDYVRGQLVSRKVTVVHLPVRFSVELGEAEGSSFCILVFFQNVSFETVRGLITVNDVHTGSVLSRLQLREPEPLLSGLSGREQGWWSRGTASVKRPMRIQVDNLTAERRTLRLECELDWNFVGTRMEFKLPKDRALRIEVLFKKNK